MNSLENKITENISKNISKSVSYPNVEAGRLIESTVININGKGKITFFNTTNNNYISFQKIVIDGVELSASYLVVPSGIGNSIGFSFEKNVSFGRNTGDSVFVYYVVQLAD